jgi:hypothetical protein
MGAFDPSRMLPGCFRSWTNPESESLLPNGPFTILSFSVLWRIGGNEIAKTSKCSEAPRLTGRRLFFDLRRKASEVPLQDRKINVEKNIRWKSVVSNDGTGSH